MSEQPVRILFLEDDPGDARLLEAMLDQAAPKQFELSLVGRLVDACYLLAQPNLYDLLLLDLDVPDSKGLPTFAQLQKQAPHLPIVIFSGLTDEATARKAVENGAQDYLLKGYRNAQAIVLALRFALERKRAQCERERLIQELQEALAQVRVLQGLLPICAWCKKIRDNKGYWNEVEEYLRKHVDVEITHGICPCCEKKELRKLGICGMEATP